MRGWMSHNQDDAEQGKQRRMAQETERERAENKEKKEIENGKGWVSEHC